MTREGVAARYDTAKLTDRELEDELARRPGKSAGYTAALRAERERRSAASRQEETVRVSFHLSIGLVGCEIHREEEIPRADLPDDELERENFLQGYAEDVFNGQIEMYWRIEDGE